jgi:hypothetical protein
MTKKYFYLSFIVAMFCVIKDERKVFVVGSKLETFKLASALHFVVKLFSLCHVNEDDRNAEVLFTRNLKMHPSSENVLNPLLIIFISS